MPRNSRVVVAARFSGLASLTAKNASGFGFSGCLNTDSGDCCSAAIGMVSSSLTSRSNGTLPRSFSLQPGLETGLKDACLRARRRLGDQRRPPHVGEMDGMPGAVEQVIDELAPLVRVLVGKEVVNVARQGNGPVRSR